MFDQIVETSAVLSQSQKNFIEGHVLSNSMPWYINDSTVPGDGFFYLSHVLIHRQEDRKNQEHNSPATYFFIDLIQNLLKLHGFESPQILRSSLNLTVYNKDSIGTIHVDHKIEHNNFIMYLNTIENAGTVIFENDKETVKYVSECKKFNYLIFPGFYHAQKFPPPGEKRTVLVATFR